MKFSNTWLLLALGGFAHGRLHDTRDLAGNNQIDLSNDAYTVTVTGNGNVPKYTFSSVNSPNQKYKVQFSKLYQMDNKGNTIGQTNIALASLNWVFGKDETTQGVFWINATSSQNAKLPCSFFAFKNYLQSDKIKFDVIINGTTLDNSAQTLVLEWKMTNQTEASSDGTQPTTESNKQVCFAGADGSASTEVCMAMTNSATVTNPTDGSTQTVDVAMDFKGGLVQVKYPAFSGDLLHDPEYTVSSRSSGGSCFSASNLVDVQGKGAIPMGDLKIGDLVKTSADGKFSRVYSFAHMDHKAAVEYLQIHTQNSQLPLEISHEHFMYVGKNQERSLVRAKDVKAGDWLGDKLVTAVESIQRRGLYAPVTESGDIMVSGIVASCYASLLDVDPSAQAYATHSILSLLRLACTVDFSLCSNETYTEDGFSTYLYGMIQVAYLIAKSGALVQWILVSITSPIMMGMLALESYGIAIGVLILGFVVVNRQVQSRKVKTL